VRVLLDGNVPRDFAALLIGHETDTIHQRRWSDLANGALLSTAASEYDAFITLDQSLQFQQNLAGRPIAVLVLRARSSRLADLQPLLAELLRVLPTAPPGRATLVGG
jgi:predicted nuclease of predicted toxin-antitoxin system